MIDYLGGKLCKNPLYMDAVCKTLPIHITNVLRVSLNVLSSLAGDNFAHNFDHFWELISFFFLSSENKEDIKIVYLVRDPRAVMNSRKNYEWCMTSENCMNPRNLCKDMVDDFKEAKRIINNKNSTQNIK